MKKEEVLALVADKKVAAGSVFDEIATAVESIEISVEGDAAAIQAELDQAKADLQAKSDELEALKSVKALEDQDLAAALAKVATDEEKLGKLKAFVADLLGA
jgi:predicted  nucleic acid-binding Zn-ribbon protein